MSWSLWQQKARGKVPTKGNYVTGEKEAEKAGETKGIVQAREAEKKAIDILKKFGADFNNKKKVMSIDVIGSYNGEDFWVEIERDHATKKWTNEQNWPYPLINIPQEKLRHFLKNPKRTFYLKFNEPLKTFLVLHGLDIVTNYKEGTLFANHGGIKALRSLIRVPKEFALFTNVNNKEVEKFIITKLSI